MVEIGRLLLECRKTKTKVITRPFATGTDNPMNQSALEANACSLRQGRENVRKSRLVLVLVLLLIGLESGVRIFSQSESVAMQNQSNHEITFYA